MEETNQNPQQNSSEEVKNNSNPTTSPAGAAEAEKATNELQEKLTLLRKEADEYLNGWRRAKADLINYKKEELTRAEMMVKFSNESLLKDLLVVMDSFDLALKSDKSGASEKGMEMIKSQFETLLRRNGVVPIKSEGEVFNPSLHEAVAEEASDATAGSVVQEITRGWKLHEKVIRPAQVKIAKPRSE